jgi:serine/threonine-protein kinase
LGRLPPAIAELERARELLGDTPPALGSLGRAYGRAGRIPEAEELIERMKIMASEKPVAAASIAAAYVGLGNHDLAIAWLEKAADNRSSWLVWSATEPWWDPLRDHPRFQVLLDRLNLRQYTTVAPH